MTTQPVGRRVRAAELIVPAERLDDSIEIRA